VTALPACLAANQVETCSAVPTSQRIGCICAQSVFNAIYNCESNLRLCLGSNLFDSDLQAELSDWHSVCDSYIGNSITTPILSTLTSTAPGLETCDILQKESACNSEAAIFDACTSSYSGLTASSDISKYSSCLCQTPLLSLQYLCEFLCSDTSSAGTSALTVLPAAKLCTNFASFMATVGLPKTLPDLANRIRWL
jgi:hypothetical protein